MLGLLKRNRHERAGFELYGTAVASARDPLYYERVGVPDTLDGRFDLVGVHAWLLIRRLNREAEPGPMLAQKVFDAMFADMDVNLRELGVGDLSVGKKVRAMWEAFHGRAAAYEAAITDPEPERLEQALARNVWRGIEAVGAAALAGAVRKQDVHLAAQAFTDLRDGRVRFLPARDALA